MVKSYLGKRNLKEQFNIDRRMAAIVVIFAITGLLLLVITLVAVNTLSSLRAFSTLQTHWTEQRKSATYYLTDYIYSESEESWDHFERARNYLADAEKLRNELDQENTDREKVSRFLTAAGLDAEDIDPMINTYERFGGIEDFAQSVEYWELSDSLVNDVKRLANTARIQLRSGEDEQPKERWLQQLRQVDDSLTTVQYSLASTLGKGTRLLKNIILWLSIGIGLILLVIGISFSVRFLNSIRKWQHSLEVNEQRYRSLFDQNPNAVYSFNRKGEFVEGNRGLEVMTGYKVEDLKGKSFKPLLLQEDLDRVAAHFEKALDGEPQEYEVKGIRKDGEIFDTQVTNLPIYVDGDIVGIYGIAQDITARKEAEEQVAEQLEEKNILLAEVHHRVKNNLALISSLLQLQRDRVNSPEVVDILDDTDSRIHSMAIIHDKLYQSELFTNLQMDEYLGELVESIHEMFGDESLEVTYELNVEDIDMDINHAIPCGLLIHELLVNVYKHAFKGRSKGFVRIELVRGDNGIRLTVEDDGAGIERPREDTGLGTLLIETLAKQLSGEIEYRSNGGTRVDVLLFATDD